MSTIDPAASSIALLVEERQRHHIEIESLLHRHTSELAHLSSLAALLTTQNQSLQDALNTISRLHHVIDDMMVSESSEADDDEGSLLELYELRRWKRDFSMEQTRGLVHTIESLRAEVTSLRSACPCATPCHVFSPHSSVCSHRPPLCISSLLLSLATHSLGPPGPTRLSPPITLCHPGTFLPPSPSFPSPLQQIQPTAYKHRSTRNVLILSLLLRPGRHCSPLGQGTPGPAGHYNLQALSIWSLSDGTGRRSGSERRVGTSL
jgi:hypothetical protein